MKSTLTKGSILLTEDIETGSLESHVVGGDDVPVRGQVQSIVEFTKEVRDAGVRLWQRLQDHLRLGAAMFGQQDFAEPSFTNDLQDIELVDQIHLFGTEGSNGSAVATIFWWRVLKCASSTGNSCSRGSISVRINKTSIDQQRVKILF